MKKIIFIIAVIILIFAGWHLIYSTYNIESVNKNKIVSIPFLVTYIINNKPVTLIDGLFEESVAPGSGSKIITRYFGDEAHADLDGDGTTDIVFLITQETRGSGTFFYVVGALNTKDGWKGSNATFIGDRITPQMTKIKDDSTYGNIVIVNYADHNPGESMSVQPSQAKSLYLKFNSETMSFDKIEM